MNIRKLFTILVSGALIFAFAGCGASTAAPESATESETEQAPVTEASETEAPVADNSDDIFVSNYAAFTVTSDSLHDGVWDEVTANSLEGANASPQLSWEPVEGATTYAIYMIDMDTAYFIHWKSDGITETSLPEGWAGTKDYIGAYPPPGSTHHYNIYVIALKNPVERMKGGINATYPNAGSFIEALDTDADGNTGNIVAVGRVCGAYTAK